MRNVQRGKRARPIAPDASQQWKWHLLCSLFHHPLLHRPPSKEASRWISFCLHASTWGRLGPAHSPVALSVCTFITSGTTFIPELEHSSGKELEEQFQLQLKMFLQGSAAEQRLGAWSRTSHQRSWGVTGSQAGHHHHNHPHGPTTQAQLSLAMGAGWTQCLHGAGWTWCPGSAGWEQSREGLMLPQPPAKRAGKETTRCSETNFTA